MRDISGNKNPNWKGGETKIFCIICNKKKYVRTLFIRKGQGKFCSLICANKFQKLNPYPGPTKTKIKIYCRYCGKIMYILPSHVGKKLFCSVEHQNLWRSNKVSGKGNPNWNGGTSKKPYCFIWTKDYKETIKERDNHVCLNPLCDKTIKRLNIHHVNFDKENCHPQNLITLCAKCNGKSNFDRNWWISWYRLILSKRYGYKYD